MLELYFEDLYFTKTEEKCPISEETWQTWLNKWFDTLKPELPFSEIYEVSLRLTDDREIQELNSQFRHKNQPTDVLSFASLELESPPPPSSEPLYLGDVIISVETAIKQAQEHNHSLNFELAWLAVHGFLHLLGWDHPDEESLKAMLTQQEILLQLVLKHNYKQANN
jgi:probable rRNA maturation factor